MKSMLWMKRIKKNDEIYEVYKKFKYKLKTKKLYILKNSITYVILTYLHLRCIAFPPTGSFLKLILV